MAITTGILTGGVNNHETTSAEANGVATDFVAEGVIGTLTNTSGVAPATGGFAVNAQGTPNNTVAVSAGVAYVTGTPSTQSSQTFRVVNSATANVTISANSSGSTKYDWIYISLDATKLNAPNSAADDVATLTASRSSSATTDDGTPPTYGYPLAVVTVANGFSSISNSNIADARTQALIGNSTGVTTGGWIPGSSTWAYASSTTMTVSSAEAAAMAVGDKVWLTQTSSKYFYITGVSGTTITLNGGSDYTLANAAITAPYWSHAATPKNFPQYFAFAPSWTNITTGNGTHTGRFTINGKIVSVRTRFVMGSTSAMGSNPVLTLPVTSSSTAYSDAVVPIGNIEVEDSGTAAFFGFMRWRSTTTADAIVGNVASTYISANGFSSTVPMTWTTNDNFACNFDYEMA